MLWWTVLAVAHAVDCQQPVAPVELDATLDRAEQAFVDLDEEGLRDAANELSGLLLPCVADPVSPERAARIHRVMGIRLYTVGDEDGARAAMHAARVADPDHAWDDALLAQSHPLRKLYDEADVEGGARRVPEPRAGSVAFDGAHGRLRPSDRPTVAQLFDETGRATATAWVGPGDALPAYRAVPRRRNTLLGCAAAAAGLGAGSYGWAWASRGDLFAAAGDPTTPADALDASRARTNALVLGSSVLVLAGAGCGTAAALVGER